jgi:hypothetical protein
MRIGEPRTSVRRVHGANWRTPDVSPAGVRCESANPGRQSGGCAVRIGSSISSMDKALFGSVRLSFVRLAPLGRTHRVVVRPKTNAFSPRLSFRSSVSWVSIELPGKPRLQQRSIDIQIALFHFDQPTPKTIATVDVELQLLVEAVTSRELLGHIAIALSIFGTVNTLQSRFDFLAVNSQNDRVAIDDARTQGRPVALHPWRRWVRCDPPRGPAQGAGDYQAYEQKQRPGP